MTMVHNELRPLLRCNEEGLSRAMHQPNVARISTWEVHRSARERPMPPMLTSSASLVPAASRHHQETALNNHHMRT